VGARVPPGEREKTYRIFLEEIPGPRTDPLEGTTLRTLTRLGVPIFIAPVKTEPRGDIEKVGFKQGELFLSVKNKGNVHFTIRAVKVEGIDASGATVFQSELAGWYLLEGHSKTFSLEVQKESCLSINAIKIEVQTDRFSIGERLDVQPEMCP
jgi:fimbrial chaperone protein